jgi:hypothetical protein
MGFETFRVELRGGGKDYREANEVVQKLAHIRLDQDSSPMQGSTFYVFDDGRHAIELELKDAPVRLSCRFTLCHPPSVDSAFLNLLRELLRQLGMEATICDDVRPKEAHGFSVVQFEEFSAITCRLIATRRAEWIKAFGDERLAATTNEVYRRIILPRCQPGIEPPA